jgi:hypothetical protein
VNHKLFRVDGHSIDDVQLLCKTANGCVAFVNNGQSSIIVKVQVSKDADDLNLEALVTDLVDQASTDLKVRNTFMRFLGNGMVYADMKRKPPKISFTRDGLSRYPALAVKAVDEATPLFNSSYKLDSLKIMYNNLSLMMERELFVHNDLHAGNVLVDKQGNLVVIDYGRSYINGLEQYSSGVYGEYVKVPAEAPSQRQVLLTGLTDLAGLTLYMIATGDLNVKDDTWPLCSYPHGNGRIIRVRDVAKRLIQPPGNDDALTDSVWLAWGILRTMIDIGLIQPLQFQPTGWIDLDIKTVLSNERNACWWASGQLLPSMFKSEYLNIQVSWRLNSSHPNLLGKLLRNNRGESQAPIRGGAAIIRRKARKTDPVVDMTQTRIQTQTWTRLEPSSVPLEFIKENNAFWATARSADGLPRLFRGTVS